MQIRPGFNVIAATIINQTSEVIVVYVTRQFRNGFIAKLQRFLLFIARNGIAGYKKIIRKPFYSRIRRLITCQCPQVQLLGFSSSFFCSRGLYRVSKIQHYMRIFRVGFVLIS
jgi:hypothetical protein